MYEAKFSKFRANRACRDEKPKASLSEAKSVQKPPRQEPTASLQDPDDIFRKLKVSERDKMHFYLIKWIFNAIKRSPEPSSKEFRELKGLDYIEKREFVQ